MNDKVNRILFCLSETAGDVFIATGVVKGLHKKFPNAKIYFATKPQYYNILNGNPDITAVVPYDETMINYRNFETWGPQKNPFDIVYCPFIVTQRIPHWIHGGHGEYLGDVYAHLCDLPSCDEQYIRLDDVSDLNLPDKFITIHAQTRQDPKDYDYMQHIINNIYDIPIVQIGGRDDKKLDGITLDLRGRTTPQTLASVFSKAKLHIGLDSFPLHIALHVNCPVVAMFGGTYMKQGTRPDRKELLYGIETPNRGPCPTSCHLVECAAKKMGFDKCINNIPVDMVLDEIRKVIGYNNVKEPEPIIISSYIIIKDGIKYGFPFEQCIRAAELVSDEVIIVDGGSTDGTLEKLKEISTNSIIPPPEGFIGTIDAPKCKVKVFQHPWDMSNPTLMGDEKTYARQQCKGTWLIQLDADEIIQEPHPGAIRNLIKQWKSTDCLDLPCINFYGDVNTIRIEDNGWKWRISHNDPNIIHGVHAEARIFDPEMMCITMDKKISDGCEYIYADTGKFINHKPTFLIEYLWAQKAVKEGVITKEDYIKIVEKVIKENVCVFHYSWLDLNRKINNGSFWDATFHGKKNQTHNTTKDITERVSANKDMLVKVSFNHPLRTSSIKIGE